MKQNLHLLKIQRAYSKMPIPTQYLLDENVKRLRTIPNVGDSTALEILAAIGMLLVTNETIFTEPADCRNRTGDPAPR